MKGRIRALDGVRACAILLVLYNHINILRLGPHAKLLGSGAESAELGVGIFFVLSGFLITTLLVRERERGFGIDLRAFYERRARRILPAFYAWLSVIAIFAAAHRLPVSESDIISTALFIRNWVPGPHTWWTANAWTLCIEEWFYLGFPALVLLARKDSRIVGTLIAIVVGEPLVRVLQFGRWHDGTGVIYQIHTRLDTIAWGCLLAFLLRDERIVRWFATRAAAYAAIVAFAVVFVIEPDLDSQGHHMLFKLLLGLTLIGSGVAVMLGYIVTNPKNFVARFLSVAPIVWIGTISYSLYLWQQLFLTKMNPLHWPLNLLAAVACACLSYYGIERPFVRQPLRPGGGASDEAAKPTLAYSR